MNVLLEADKIIHGERRDAYGSAKESFAKVAKVWSAIIGVEVNAEQVALCMAGLKIIRECASHKTDNLVDAAGYIGLAEECVGI